MISRLKDQLDSGETTYACWCKMRDLQLTSLIASQKFDVLVLDAQHGFHDESSILDSIPLVLNAGKSPLVRIPLNRWDMAQKVLDFGAIGVVAPMIDSKEEAEAFADSMKYPPVGSRSHSPKYAGSLYGLNPPEYLHAADKNTIALVQIETRKAYENLDEILSVEGIDGILMGPADFSIFMTGNVVPDPYGEGTIKEVEDIAKRTLAAGKYAAAFTVNPEHTKLVRSFGYQMISIAMDENLVEAGSKSFFSAI